MYSRDVSCLDAETNLSCFWRGKLLYTSSPSGIIAMLQSQIQCSAIIRQRNFWNTASTVLIFHFSARYFKNSMQPIFYSRERQSLPRPCNSSLAESHQPPTDKRSYFLTARILIYTPLLPSSFWIRWRVLSECKKQKKRKGIDWQGRGVKKYGVQSGNHAKNERFWVPTSHLPRFVQNYGAAFFF